MARTSKDFGYWHSLGQLRMRQLFNWQNVFCMVVGAGVGVAAGYLLQVSDRIAIADDMKSLAGGLVGIVFSSLALVIGLMPDRYALWLARSDGGALAFLRPFFVGVGIQVGTLLLVVLYRAVARHVPVGVEQVLFGILTAAFFVAMLDIVSLAKMAFAHGVTRADAAELDELEKNAAERRPRGT